MVKDPVSGGFYRLRETERFIAEQLDGVTPLEEVRRRTEQKFGGALAPDTLRWFVQRLDQGGLLERDDPARVPKAAPRGRIRGSLLYLRFALFDPDRVFARLERRLRFLWTPHFVAVATLVILIAFAVVAGNWTEIRQGLPRIFRLQEIPLIFAVTMGIVAAHESAHGLTCKHFGGEVHETGFLLIYFQPAFYCNVSDAWLFPERSKRLWVGFAGPYFELFLWALATILWRASDPESRLYEVAFIVMTISGVKTLFNFNPFIKLDGYYLLSDYFGLPNLRRRSYRYLGERIKRLLGFGAPARGEMSRRERRIYFAYGLTATVGSTLALIYAFGKLGGYLVANRNPAALAVMAGYVGLKSRRRFRKLFGGSTGVLDGEDDGDDDFAGSASGDTGSPAVPAKRSRRELPRGQLLRRTAWAALLAGAAVFMGVRRTELRITGSFSVLPDQNADVRAETDGIIAEVMVHEGDTVRAGQVIARLSDQATLAELGKTEAEIRENEANLRKLQAGPSPQEIALARAGVTKSQEKLRYEEARLERLTTLAEQRLAPREEYDDAREQTAIARGELEQANRQLDVLLHGTRPEEIEALRARIEGLYGQRRFLKEQLQRLNVLSPITGIAATPSRELDELKGHLLAKGDLIAKVYDFTTVQAQIPVSERDIADVRVGQAVLLRVRAYPNQQFHGTVTTIGTSAAGTTTATPQTPAPPAGSRGVPGGAFIVTTRIDNGSLLLRPGMTGQAKIVCGPRRGVSLLARRLARTFKVELWSWW